MGVTYSKTIAKNLISIGGPSGFLECHKEECEPNTREPIISYRELIEEVELRITDSHLIGLINDFAICLINATGEKREELLKEIEEVVG